MYDFPLSAKTQTSRAQYLSQSRGPPPWRRTTPLSCASMRRVACGRPSSYGEGALVFSALPAAARHHPAPQETMARKTKIYDSLTVRNMMPPAFIGNDGTRM